HGVNRLDPRWFLGPPCGVLRSPGMAAKKRHPRVIPIRRKGGSRSASPPPADPPSQGNLPPPEHPAADRIAGFPPKLRTGDRYTDDSGQVWIVTGPPTGLRHGKMMMVRFKGTDDGRAQWQHVWPAHERVRVRRAP